MTSEELLLTDVLSNIRELRSEMSELKDEVNSVSHEITLTKQVMERMAKLETKIAMCFWLILFLAGTLVVLAVADFDRLRALLEYVQ